MWMRDESECAKTGGRAERGLGLILACSVLSPDLEPALECMEASTVRSIHRLL